MKKEEIRERENIVSEKKEKEIGGRVQRKRKEEEERERRKSRNK